MLFVQACHDKRGRNYNEAQNDTVVIKNGIEGCLTEIKVSGLAITNSNNQRVISLAKTIIDDHTKIGDEFNQLKADKKIAGNDTISSAH